MGYSHCKGILVYDANFSTDVPTGWSPDAKQPNRDFGLQYGPNNTQWNKPGTGLHWQDLSYPIFHLGAQDYARVMEVRYLCFFGGCLLTLDPC